MSTLLISNSCPEGRQAGRLRIGAEEKPATIRRRLGVAAKTLGIPLIIKRSGTDVYFWRENGGEEQPRPRRGRRPRMGSPGSLIPPDMLIPEPAEDRGSLPSSPSEAGEQEGAAEETTAPDQAFSKSEYLPIDKFPGVVAPFEHDLPSRP